MCADKRVLVSIAAAVTVLLLLTPDLAAPALPLLMVAVCPLSMLFIARAMRGQPGPNALPAEHELAAPPSEAAQLHTDAAEPNDDRAGAGERWCLG
jgi:hypothetical protein